MSKCIGRVTLECITGDISAQHDIEAIVNAGDAQMLPVDAAGRAIHRVAGPGLADECSRFAPIKPGDAVLTRGYNLPNAWVIHCLGPRYNMDEPAAALLGDCYRYALLVADEHGISSVAFPAISIGEFGYPLSEAAAICARAVAGKIPHLARVKLIRFVFGGKEIRRQYEQALVSVGLL